MLDFASKGVNGKVSSRAEDEKMLRISESDMTGKESSGEKKSDILNILHTHTHSEISDQNLTEKNEWDVLLRMFYHVHVFTANLM